MTREGQVTEPQGRERGREEENEKETERKKETELHGKPKQTNKTKQTTPKTVNARSMFIQLTSPQAASSKQ